MDIPIILASAWSILAAFCLFFRLGAGTLKGWDEAFYGAMAKHMLRTRDYLTLHFNFEPERSGKVPLYLWLTVLTMKVWGETPWAVRFWSAFFGWATFPATFFLGQALFNEWVGLAAMMVLLTIPHYVESVRPARLDSLVAFFIVVALLCFWHGQTEPRWLLAMGAATGLAILGKGVVGLFPYVIVGTYVIFSGGWSLLLSAWLWGSIGVGLAVALPWHLIQWKLHGKRFLQAYFVFNLLNRTRQVVTHGGGGPAFYLYILKDGSRNVWYLFMAAGIGWCGWQGWSENNLAGLLILSWVMAIVFPFSLAKTKLAWYMVPVYPALALAVSAFLCHLGSAPWVGATFAGILALTRLNFPFLHLRAPPEAQGNPELASLAEKMGRRSGPDAALVVYETCPEEVEWPAGTFYSWRKTWPLGGAYNNEWGLDLPTLAQCFDRYADIWCILKHRDLGDFAGLPYAIVEKKEDSVLVRKVPTEPPQTHENCPYFPD